MRKERFAIGYVYHIYNRGTDKRKIFLTDDFYNRFLATIEHYLDFDYPFSLLRQRLANARSAGKKKEILDQLEHYRITPKVEPLAFSLMPNHFHLCLKQLREKGVSEFMHRIGTSYTNYFNLLEDRTGRLFEGTFKARRVASDGDLLNLTRYIHINPLAVVEEEKEIYDYPWSSLGDYVGNNRHKFVRSEMVVESRQEKRKYKDFVGAELKGSDVAVLSKIAIDDDFGWFEQVREEKKERRRENTRYLYQQSEL